MIHRTTIEDCRIIELGKIHNQAGNITVIEGEDIVPFKVKRIYYLYDIPGGAERGGHAHLLLRQAIIAASGSFSVKLDDGYNQRIVDLNHPNIGLLVVSGIWRELFNFSSGSICLVLASGKYDEKDYIRDYEKYIEYKKR